MRIIKPEVKIIGDGFCTSESETKQWIEQCARICYKSEKSIITKETAEKFVTNLYKNGHTSAIEHGTIYLTIPWTAKSDEAEMRWIISQFKTNPYSCVVDYTSNDLKEFLYITTDYLVLLQNNWLWMLKYMAKENNYYHEKRITVKFLTDIGTMTDYCRSRDMSISCESTIYCNYSKDKFDHELTFITPTYQPWGFVQDCNHCEQQYFSALEGNSVLHTNGKITPKDIRGCLTKYVKTELIMTGFVHNIKKGNYTIQGWEHFFDLRDNDIPDVARLSKDLHQQFKNCKLL